MSWLFTSGGQSIGASSFSISPSNEYSGLISFRIDWFGPWTCSVRDSQESSSNPQFKSINSSVLSLLYSPTLASVHDYRKHHNFDYTDLCWQSNVSDFNTLSRFCSPGSSVHGILQARVLEWVAIPSPGDLPDPGIEPRSSALQEDGLPSEPPGKPQNMYYMYVCMHAKPL